MIYSKHNGVACLREFVRLRPANVVAEMSRSHRLPASGSAERLAPLRLRLCACVCAGALESRAIGRTVSRRRGRNRRLTQQTVAAPTQTGPVRRARAALVQSWRLARNRSKMSRLKCYAMCRMQLLSAIWMRLFRRAKHWIRSGAALLRQSVKRVGQFCARARAR